MTSLSFTTMRRVVALTGAGISAESGVSTFRDADGVWAKYDYRDVATPEGFAANPALVHDFYNARRRSLGDIAPNEAHNALTKLEHGLEALGGAFTLITQNVDGLHARAGARNLYEMHGALNRARCNYCGSVRPCDEDLSIETVCAACGRAGGMRPDVVWFGEIPMHMDEAGAALAEADLFVAIGTSGAVYPAAGFVGEARMMGIATLELNLEPSDNASVFDQAIYGPATQIVPDFVNAVLEKR